jgi:hypothetical protein
MVARRLGRRARRRHPGCILPFYRRELRPVIATGDEIMNQIFSSPA